MVRRRLLLPAAALAVAAAVAVPIVVLAGGSGGNGGPTRESYLAQVNAICRRYEARLQRIDAPANYGNPQVVRQAVGKALPLVAARVDEIRPIEPPEAMQAQVRRMLAAEDAATAALRLVLVAAQAEDVPRMGSALVAFIAAREAARKQAAAVGISC